MTNDHQRVGQVGCIDGSILEVRRHAGDWILSVGDSEVRLSAQAAARLASLLTAVRSPSEAAVPSEPVQAEQPPGDSTPSEPSGSRARPEANGAWPSPDDPKTSKLRGRARERVVDLVEAGVISPGEILTMNHRGSVYRATVAADGSIEFEGRVCKSPSEASRCATGTARNGWRDWKVMDGLSLDDLRWRLRADRFPGEGHDYAASTAQEKQRLALRWVKHALENGLDPAVRDEGAVADLLARGDYAASTLQSYDRHLDEWFEMHGRRP